MSNLMDELMAEIKRVKNLETEVNTAINATYAEVNKARTEKLAEIFAFINEISNALRDAGMLKYSSSYLKVDTNITNSNGRYKWTYSIGIMADKSYAKLFFHDGYPSEDMLYANLKHNYAHAKYVIDNWDDATYTVVRNEVAKRIKEELARRIDDATKRLRTANEKHGKYYSKDEILESYNLL